MADDKERLIVQLEARINEFEKRMKRAEKTGTRSYKKLRRGSRSATAAMERDMLRSTTAINKALATTSARIGTFGKTMAAGLAGGLVTAALAGVTGSLTSVVKGIASVGDEAKRSGLDVKTFQEWKFVAEQNRIGIDQMVDGFKELNLRADEFAVTGKGPAAEAFQRIGLTGQDLKRKLKDPSALMLEIVERMEDLDNAAQIRVADEIFGGSAGERFVELLSQGEEGLRRTVSRAHEVGAVMDSEMIAKADELDRKYGELAERASRIGKSLAVGLTTGLSGILSASRDLEGMFGSMERAEAVLGKELAESLSNTKGAISEHADDLRDLHGTYDELFALINQMTGPDGVRVFEIDNVEAKFALSDIMTGLKDLVVELENGQISANDFEEELKALIGDAQDVADDLEAIDDVGFSNVVTAIGHIGTALQNAISKAQALKAELPGDAGGATLRQGPPTRVGKRKRSDLAPTTSVRPKTAPSLLGEPDIVSGGGGGGGGGSSRGDDYAREVAQIREKTAALEAEAVALVAAGASGQQYGNALDYARKRAELLHAAQQAGKEITPQLQAEIDALAAAYVSAGDAADDAADKLQEIEDSAERGADALSDVFLGIMDGSRSAKEAVAELLKEMARIQIQKGFANLSAAGGGGGALGFLGSLLGFASGGYTGHGATNQIAGAVHKGEYVFDAAATRRIGVGNLEAMRSGQPSGGAGHKAKDKPQQVELVVHADQGITIEQVRGEAVRIVQAGMMTQDRKTGQNIQNYSRREG
ncbi:phage tail tape measure protein [Sedimentitalea todarodis]|uniref:Tail tape measure protein n=1 Tax=Sedimentitalea todarodis TaxID=1631240 RepID=A0ABU3VHT9_9RHOB|nr:hypothetical protein [Sedimentitalea todarodis]MDU9005742.1 hypothetical protein [Sedimentitalea todarodis]